jgi:hypothetical protein
MVMMMIIQLKGKRKRTGCSKLSMLSRKISPKMIKLRVINLNSSRCLAEVG